MTAMPVTYETWLVLLSIVMAIQGAYVGLSLAVQIGAAAGMRRRLLLAGAAFSLAIAIWTMHFVGMLAARIPFPVDYLVFPTLLSFLVCVVVVGAAVYAASSGPLTLLRLTLSACLMGGGIFAIHYIGMSALPAEAVAKRAERELRLAINTIPALVWSALPDGSLDFINQRWDEVGLSLDDLRGSEWIKVLHPDERAGVTDRWRTAVETGTSYE